MRVVCRTNLDISCAEKWPTELEALPRVGDHITSGYWHPSGRRLTLRVCGVTFEPHKSSRHPHPTSWVPTIELHMPSWLGNASILDFNEWYKTL